MLKRKTRITPNYEQGLYKFSLARGVSIKVVREENTLIRGSNQIIQG